MILDGWGLGDGSKADVIANMPTPNMDRLAKEYPTSRLFASGEDVGLPDGQMQKSAIVLCRKITITHTRPATA